MLLRGSLPDKSDFDIDFNIVRKLADADLTELPIQINYLVIATGKLPGWGTVAGDFGNDYRIELRCRYYY